MGDYNCRDCNALISSGEYCACCLRNFEQQRENAEKQDKENGHE